MGVIQAVQRRGGGAAGAHQAAQETDSEAERQSLLARARILNTMRQETHEIAVLTEHYYERNYCRNAKYIL